MLATSPQSRRTVESNTTSAILTDEQFRRLAATISSVLWRMNDAGTHFVAPRWAELTGRREHELNNGGWLASVHDADRDAVATELRSARTYGIHFQVDARLRLRDGACHWYRIRGEPIHGAHGEVTGWMGLATNIDEQKRAETALLESEQRLRMVIEAARVGTIDHDLVTGKIAASRTSKVMLGVPVETEITQDWLRDRLHPDDRELFQAASMRAAHGDGKFELIFRLMHTDGDPVWINARGTYLFEGEGVNRRPVRFVGVAGDLTGHMRDLAEGALASAIITSSQDAIMTCDRDGVITHWNAAAERMFGYAAGEMLGDTKRRFVSADEVPLMKERIERVMRGEWVAPYVARFVRKDGRPLDVSVAHSAVHDQAGRITGRSAIMHDVTHQRRLEAEMVQAQKMEAVGLIAGGVVHDLSNSLTTILAELELAEQMPSLDPEMRQSFREVRKACHESARVVRQLLTVGRRHASHPVVCSVNDIAREGLPMMKRLLGESIRVATQLDATWGALVDPVQLNQAMLNLAANARDAMPNGGTLTIVTRDDAATGMLLLEVRDTGCGMSEETRARIFEPFFTTKGDEQGSGLGLSAVCSIVEESSGTIEVESTVGVGTTFVIRLPGVEEPQLAS